MECCSVCKKTNTSKVNETVVKELKEVQTEANGLRDSATALMQRGSNSVCKEGKGQIG